MSTNIREGIVDVENHSFYLMDDALADQVGSIRFTGGLVQPGVGAVAIRTLEEEGFVHVRVVVHGGDPGDFEIDPSVVEADQVSYPTATGSQRVRAGTFGECFGELGEVLTPPGPSAVTVRAIRTVVDPYTLENVKMNAAFTMPEVTISENYVLHVWSTPADPPVGPVQSSYSGDYTGVNMEYADEFPLQPGSSLLRDLD